MYNIYLWVYVYVVCLHGLLVDDDRQNIEVGT